MITVRALITEALSRSNLVSRRQSASADMVESAFRLLKGIASKYSNDNLLTFLTAQATHVLDKREFVIGEFEDVPLEYLTLDIECPRIQKVNKVYWRSTDTTGLGNYVELKFASPDDFDSYPDGCAVYTAQPINDLQIILKTKLVADSRIELKIMYNRKWKLDLDDELRIPEQFTELFTVALTHALALAFPRLSTEQVNLLKNELKEMEDNVRVSSRAVKYVSRTPVRTGISRAAFLSGSMFFPEG